MTSHFDLIALNKIRFKRFTYVFSIHCISWMIFFYLTGNSESPFLITALIMIIVTKLSFLYYIGDLAAAAKKSVFLWVLGSLVFVFIGPLIAYFRMRVIAVTNGWV